MKRLSNYTNILILTILTIFFLYFDSYKAISYSLNSILPQGEQKELIKKFNEFQTTKKLFLYVEGTNKESLKTIKDIENKFSNIVGITRDKLDINKALKNFENEYYLYLNNFNIDSYKNLNITNKLEELKLKLLNSDFSYFINTNDPLNLFTKDEEIKNFSIKNNHIILNNQGYLSIFTIKPEIQSLNEYEKLYNNITNSVSSQKDIKLFSPIFYFVENQKTIKKDVNLIILLSTLILLTLYIIILKNIKLLFNTLITLSSSIVLSLLVLSLLFDEISIFVLVFGISISTVAIDYMFHHFVHGHYSSKKSFNKDVFLGFLTTTLAFLLISFISFDLIKQLCYFTIISLLFSYIQFAFIYPKIGFKYTNFNKLNFTSFKKVPSFIIIFISLITITMSLSQWKFDSNLKNLDVENKKLDSLQSFFAQALLNKELQPFLIQANTLEDLIIYSKELKDKYINANIPLSKLVSKDEFEEKKKYFDSINLDKLKQELDNKALETGFKSGYFKNSYNYKISVPIYDLTTLQTMGFEIKKYKNSYITFVNLPKQKLNEFKDFEYIKDISTKVLFEEKLKTIKNELLLYGFFTIIMIVFILFLNNRKNILTSITYLIFPISLILTLSFFTSFNILHIFMLFIIVAISIDFGIYMSSNKKDENTNKAIFYSLLSTIAGFAVLIFSKTNSLFSIGVVATIGAFAILFLLIFLRDTHSESSNL